MEELNIYRKYKNSTSNFLPELSDLLPRLSVWTEYSFIVQPLQSQHLKWDKSDHILETNVKSAVQNKLNISQCHNVDWHLVIFLLLWQLPSSDGVSEPQEENVFEHLDGGKHGV